MPELKLLFLEMAVILTTARLMAVAFRFIGQPEVMGEMAAGILLGPSFLGRISPAMMNRLFPAGGLGSLYALSQLGLVLFMFLVGLEVRPGSLRGSAKSVIVASQASIMAPFLLGGVLAWSLYPRLGNGAPRLPFVLFLGAAMGITAFPVLARILADCKLTHTRVGVFALSCAAIDDVTAWCLLAVITVIARPEANQNRLPWRFAALVGYILAMVFLVRPALRRLLPASATPDRARFGAAMIFLLLSVWATEALAVHALFGAFLAGIVMPKGGQLQEGLRDRLESVTLVLLLPLFFAYTGLRTSIALLNSVELWLLCGLIVMVAVGSKLLVSGAIVHASGMPWRESLAVGVLVNTRGLVELVILNVGLDLHILSPTLFSMMVIMALVTTLMTTPLIDWILPPSS
ncbi:MAG TPA: cation:proton antiporter [Gemmataceae bacterium]|nr:cation:proton antiporter [Gemmataceae bacterium]